MGRFDYSFLLKDIAGRRGKELAGEWAGYRSRMLLAYTSDRDTCVWEPGLWPVS